MPATNARKLPLPASLGDLPNPEPEPDFRRFLRFELRRRLRLLIRIFSNLKEIEKELTHMIGPDREI